MRRKFLCVVLLAIFVFIFPAETFGTVTIAATNDFLISVDGQPFRVWGYQDFRGDGDHIPYFRLHDIAYILNGTSAQFEIIGYGDAGFRISRGLPHIANFTELQRFSEYRFALINGQFLPYPHSVGFTAEPFRNVLFGIDDGGAPAGVINLHVIRDIDDTFFSLADLSYWLGFSAEWLDRRDGFHGNIISVSTTIPASRTPSRHITRDTFPIGSRQTIDYAHTLIVRRGPGNDYGILTYVYRGDEFEVLDYNGRFVQIETADGLGWIFAGFFSRRRGAIEPILRDDAQIRYVLRQISASHLNPWIDGNFYETEIIDGNVIAPVNFFVWPTIHSNIDDTTITGGISRGLIELNTMGLFMGAFAIPTMPVTSVELESGIFELRYDFSRPITWQDHGDIWSEPWRERQQEIHESRRIVVDTNETPVQTIRYYIDDVVHNMVRFDETRDMSRYEFSLLDDGIRLAWRFPPNINIWLEGARIHLYRSTVQGQRGQRVREIDISRGNLSWLYEYIDTDVSTGGTYFYSLWVHDIDHFGSEGAYSERRIIIGGERQMTVSTPSVQ